MLTLWRCWPDPSGDTRFWASEPDFALSFGYPGAQLIRGELDLSAVALVCRPGGREWTGKGWLYPADYEAQRELLRAQGADWVAYSDRWDTHLYSPTGHPGGPYLYAGKLTLHAMTFGRDRQGRTWFPIFADGRCFAHVSERGAAAVHEVARWMLPDWPFTFVPNAGIIPA